MLETIEHTLFYLVSASYLIAWCIYIPAWRIGEQKNIEAGLGRKIGTATNVMRFGVLLHACFLGLRYYRADHIPMLTAYEFVTAFAFFVALTFLVFARDRNNQLLGIFLVPVILCLLIYAGFMSTAIEPEIPIFDGLMLQIHIVTVLIGYSAWAITFAASVCYLYLEKKGNQRRYLMDKMSSTSAFIAFCFLTISIVSGALWSDNVFGQLWFWDPKETWSFITWLIFLAYLHSRYNNHWEGHRAAILAIIGFASVVFTSGNGSNHGLIC
jgi:ABC-type transport system involved in cytochrome c biogenesis permease subunit